MNERSSPSDARDERPLAVVDRIGGALRLVAVDARARDGGCAVGASLAEARAVAPSLRAEPAMPEEDLALLEAVADWCDRYTPLVALDGAGGLLLDVTGCAHFYDGEGALGADLVGRLSARGLAARAAVAGAAGPARALAWFGAGGVVPPGGEAGLVARLPVAALGLARETAVALGRAGLKSVGDVAARGRGELAARFGAALVEALDLALGRSDPPISPRRPVPSRAVERRFPEPLSTVEAALAMLRALADALVRRLEAAGEGVRLAEAAFFRADGRTLRVSVGTGAPTRDPDMLLRLFRERLDALADPLDPGFGFDLMRLSACAVEPLAPLAPDFAGADRVDCELDALVDRLSARHGRRRVLRFGPRDAHRPEAEVEPRPAQGFSEAALLWSAARGAGGPPRRPLRMFAPPEPIEVIAEVPDGPPALFVWRRATHRVARAEGPERIALEWWRSEEAPLTRDYFRVEDEAGARFWLYRDGLFVREAERPRWYLHGLFA